MERTAEKHNAILNLSWFTTQNQTARKCERFVMRYLFGKRYIARHASEGRTDMAVPDKSFPFACVLQRYTGREVASTSDLRHIGDCHCTLICCRKMTPRLSDRGTFTDAASPRRSCSGGRFRRNTASGNSSENIPLGDDGRAYFERDGQLKRAFDPNGILGRGNILTRAIALAPMDFLSGSTVLQSSNSMSEHAGKDLAVNDIGSSIGAGGMGEVFLAPTLNSNVNVALNCSQRNHEKTRTGEAL